MKTITGILDDYALMTDGVHKGRYGAKIDGIPYPVTKRVDAFLVRFQKGVKVDVTIQDNNGVEWIDKIVKANPSAKSAASVQTPEDIARERDAYNARAADEARNQERKIAEMERITAKVEKQKAAAEAEKLKAAGFGTPTAAPNGNGNPVCAECPKVMVESIRGRVCAVLGVPCNQISKERCQVEIEVEKREKKISPQEKPKETCTSPKSPVEIQPTQLVPAHPIQNPANFNSDEISLIKSTVARNCTDTEFKLLMYLSAQYGLDPIRRQIWAVKYGDAPASIFTGRDGFLEIAHRSGVFDGMESGIKKEGDEIIGWAKVYRKDMTHAFYVEVYLKEYTTGKNLWLSKPRIMIQKVAESSALRRAFSVSGLYCPEEMPEQVGA
jgi:phage recombination protein Bet